MTEELIKDVLRYIEDNLYECLKVEELSEYFHYSRYYLLRVFKKYTGLTINDYINQRKIIKSIDKLINSDNRILNIALTTGFNSLEYYSETFLKVTHFSPLEFRKNPNIAKYLPFDYSNDLMNSLLNNNRILNNIKNIKKPIKVLNKSLKK